MRYHTQNSLIFGKPALQKQRDQSQSIIIRQLIINKYYHEYIHVYHTNRAI